MARLGRGEPFPPLIQRTRILSTDVTVALTGVSGTGGLGTLAVALAIGLSGLAGTGGVGTALPQTTVAITGSAATGSVGTVTESHGGSAALTSAQSRAERRRSARPGHRGEVRRPGTTHLNGC